MRLSLLTVCLFFAGFSVAAQQVFVLHVHFAADDSVFLQNHFSYQQKFRDTTSRKNAISQLLNELHDAGYLQASAENAITQDSLMRVKIAAGERWYWNKLENGNVNEEILREVRFHGKAFSGKPFQMNEVNRFFDAILKYEENHGYPFADVHLDSVHASGYKISAKIFMQEGSFVTIDSLGISGNLRFSKSFLENYLNLHVPTAYNQHAIQNSTLLFKALPYLTVTKEPKAEIFKSSATATFFLDKKPANQFDLVIGFLQNNVSTGKLVVSGQGQLSLENAFGHGESFQLQFSRLSPRSATVDIRGSYPYLFSLPVGLNAAFNLYKNDSLYLNVKEEIGAQFFFNGIDFIKVFYSHFGSSLLTIDTEAIKQTHALPSSLDERNNEGGAGIYLSRFDDIVNPGRGYDFNLNGAFGERKILKNPAITRLTDASDTFNYTSLYDTFPSHTIQGSLQLHFSGFIPFSRSLVGKLSFDDATLLSRDILINEWYHIGGFRLLRGFDEWSVAASHYDVLSLELHYLLTPNAYAMVFSDNAYIQQHSVDTHCDDFPFGFGLGFQLQTKAGLFSIAAALGKSKQQALLLKNAKIHIGYVNYF